MAKLMEVLLQGVMPETQCSWGQVLVPGTIPWGCHDGHTSADRWKISSVPGLQSALTHGA